MKLGLKNKVVIVTGGANGIGEAIVRGLLLEDAKPVILDKDTNKCQKLAHTLSGKYKHDIDCYITDLSDPLLLSVTLNEINNQYPTIYGLVNNAGVNDGVSLDATLVEFEASLAKNLLHYFQVTQAFVSKIKESEGSIVNVSSKVAITGQGGTSGYAASKGAINALTREWAVDLARYNVDVNCIIPAEVMTPQYKNWIKKDVGSEEKLDKIVKKINMGHRLTTPVEIANYALFLLSNKSSHFTGQWVFVDGGYTHLDDSKEL